MITDKTTETGDQRHKGRQSASTKNAKGGALLVRSGLSIAEDIHTGVVSSELDYTHIYLYNLKASGNRLELFWL